ncbi:hypothetical protein ACP3WW_24135, partial [Salmonella enterica]|uniref:hypothetical protein n=1 Tax=Salmonella enterica TaxID=28901 RepID=UPI003CF38E04
VLHLSRRSEATPTTLELTQWLVRAVEAYGEAHPERRPQFGLETGDELLPVRFDPGHLQQILFNLWDNSFEHAGRP